MPVFHRIAAINSKEDTRAASSMQRLHRPIRWRWGVEKIFVCSGFSTFWRRQGEVYELIFIELWSDEPIIEIETRCALQMEGNRVW